MGVRPKLKTKSDENGSALGFDTTTPNNNISGVGSSLL
jgi:hypothetical protein